MAVRTVKGLRIAQVATLIESVPPRLYGGTERVVSYLTEALVAQGHQVTLFASGDSITGAELISCSERALRFNAPGSDPLPYYMMMLDKVRTLAAKFDIIHFHIEQFHFPLFKPLAGRTLTTLHGRQDLPGLKNFYAAFPEMPLVSISHAQRRHIPEANFVATIHHGLPSGLHKPTLCPRGGYLAFLGRISPEKGVDRAIEIARASGLPLKIAAKVDRQDKAYFEQAIRPLLDQPGIEFVGEISEREKGRFLGEALALLFPIDWPEPFGLVLIEAMACGTPVLAFGKGSVPEIVEDGVTGAIVYGMDETPRALARVIALDRAQVRRRFEERFTAERMAADYVKIYERLLAWRRQPAAPSKPVAIPDTVVSFPGPARPALGSIGQSALAIVPPEE
jgi:glycosyltransferase involved in cell wall biosynthesis